MAMAKVLGADYEGENRMIVMDKPRKWLNTDKPMSSAYLFSSFSGKKGTEELLAFASGIGLKPHWIQQQATPWEHFDIFGSKIAAARKAGAQEFPDQEIFEIRASKVRKSQKFIVPDSRE